MPESDTIWGVSSSDLCVKDAIRQEMISLSFSPGVKETVVNTCHRDVQSQKTLDGKLAVVKCQKGVEVQESKALLKGDSKTSLPQKQRTTKNKFVRFLTAIWCLSVETEEFEDKQ